MKLANKYSLEHAGTCLPDYWAGHHRAHLMIAISPGMSMREIKALLCDELRQGAVMGGDRLAELLGSDWVPPADEKDADRAVRRAYAAINRMRPTRKGQRSFFTDVEMPEDEEDESIYAYFVFRPEE